MSTLWTAISASARAQDHWTRFAESGRSLWFRRSREQWNASVETGASADKTKAKVTSTPAKMMPLTNAFRRNLLAPGEKWAIRENNKREVSRALFMHHFFSRSCSFRALRLHTHAELKSAVLCSHSGFRSASLSLPSRAQPLRAWIGDRKSDTEPFERRIFHICNIHSVYVQSRTFRESIEHELMELELIPLELLDWSNAIILTDLCQRTHIFQVLRNKAARMSEQWKLSGAAQQ